MGNISNELRQGLARGVAPSLIRDFANWTEHMGSLVKTNAGELEIKGGIIRLVYRWSIKASAAHLKLTVDSRAK